MRVLSAFLLLAVVLAGCSGESAGKDDEEEVETPPVEVTDTTGGIRGIVVDEAIKPLGGVLVKLTGQTEMTTDVTGTFVFSKLEPGDYFVGATKPGYEAAQQTATVEAGVADPDLVKIQLVKIPGADPYFQSFKLDGFYECGFALFFITDSCDFGYRTAWDEYNNSQGPPPGGLPRTIQGFSNTQYIEVGTDIQSIIQEAFWDDANVESMMISVAETPIDNACDCSASYLEVVQPNPTYGRLDAGEDGSNAALGAGKLVAARGFLPFQELTGASTALNFDFVIITTMFYNYQPTEGWNFVENGQDDL